MTFDNHEMSENFMSRIRFSYKSQDSDRIVADVTHQRSDSEPTVDTVGIYVRIILVRIENAAFGHDLICEIWMSEGFSPVA